MKFRTFGVPFSPGAVLAALLALAACDTPLDQAMPGQAASGPQTESPGPRAVQPESDPQFRMESELALFFDKRFQAGLDLSPMRQTSLGIYDNNDKWDQVGEEQDLRYHQVAQGSLRGLSGFNLNGVGETSRVSAQVFAYGAQQSIDGHQWRYHRYIVSQFGGAHTGVPSFLINFHLIRERKDAEDYIARLYDTERYIDQTVEAVRIRAEKGYIAPAFTFPMVIEAARNVISGFPFDQGPADTPILADFKRKLSESTIPEVEHRDLIADAEAAMMVAVRPAYQRFIAYMEELGPTVTTDHGVWKLDPTGGYYQRLLKYHTTTELTADEIHDIGLAEMDRIHDEMRAIMVQVGFEGTLQDFFEFTRTDEQFYYPNTDEGREAYLAEATAIIDGMKTRLDEIFITKPKAPMIVKRVEPFREASAGKAFYSGPAPDGSRPGIYYANLYEMSQMPKYQMEALAFHEGIPGHHMQIAIAQELEDMPRFRRFGGYTAYSEGWGLYTEFLPKEMGFYEDPYSDFGRLAMELWRAARLVVDTGIHQKRWTREEASQYLIQNTPNPEEDCRKAIDRYLVYPGQATAYKIGMLKLLELRGKAENELGGNFDIRVFHDTILRNGSVPLPILEEIVEGYVSGAKTSG